MCEACNPKLPSRLTSVLDVARCLFIIEELREETGYKFGFTPPGEVLETQVEILEEAAKEWADELLPALSMPHSGDCTNEPHTCQRCYTERLVSAASVLLATAPGSE